MKTDFSDTLTNDKIFFFELKLTMKDFKGQSVRQDSLSFIALEQNIKAVYMKTFF